jgi:hypothetical protein
MAADPIYERLLHFEDCASAIDQLFQKAFREHGPTAFDEFLRFVIRFNDLSVYNAMLVRVQRPGATGVGFSHQMADSGSDGSSRRSADPHSPPVRAGALRVRAG